MPRYHSTVNLPSRMCIWCQSPFSPTRWDQAYCDTGCARSLNENFKINSYVLEVAHAIESQQRLCWNCQIVPYPLIYPQLVRPWVVYQGYRAGCSDIVAVCADCKPAVRVLISLGALIDDTRQ